MLHMELALKTRRNLMLRQKWKQGLVGSALLALLVVSNPMVNASGASVKVLPDQWTVVTKDHSLSAQWEHTVLVTKNGFEVLTLAPSEMTS